MTWHVVCLAGVRDTFHPDLRPNDRILWVPFDNPGHVDASASTIATVLATYRLAPSPAASDLLRAAIGAYTADKRVPRQDAYDRWTRDLMLYIPVQEPIGWDAGARILAELLGFLTGDRWNVRIRAAPPGYRPHRAEHPRRVYRLEADTVALFSGGLDSYIGAIDLLTDGGRVVLVGHHAAGEGATSVAQVRAFRALRRAFPGVASPLLRFWFSPPVTSGGASETTTRCRSLLFLALGTVVANALNASRLVVPENGLISLNVPLTPARIGSFSTRTTHPHLIALLRSLLSSLGIMLAIEVPYRFRTKGEMVAECREETALDQGLAVTMSCAHPGAGRFGGARNPNQHCGRCIPCIIRRAAIAASRVDPTPYAWIDLRQSLSEVTGIDLRAVGIALDRYVHAEPRLIDVLQAGPLPGTDEELREYVAVFHRGLNEVRQFIETLTVEGAS